MVLNGRHGPGFSEQYPDSYESNRGNLRSDRNQWQGGDGNGYESRSHHEGGPHSGGGRMAIQQLPQRSAEARNYGDPRARGQPRSKSRPPERDRHWQEDSRHQFVGIREPQGFQQQHPPEQRSHHGSAKQNNDSFEYKESFSNYRNGGERDHWNDPSVKEDYGYYNPRSATDGWGKEYSDGINGRESQNHSAATPDTQKPKHQVPSQLLHGQPLGSSARLGIPQKTKTCESLKCYPTMAYFYALTCFDVATHRNIQTPVSPDTIAWDNPFPTFPMKPKKGPHSGSRSFDGSVAETDNKGDRQRDNSHHDRPQTAISKSSSYTVPQSQGPNNSNSNSDSHENGNFGRDARAQDGNPTVAQERPRSNKYDHSRDHLYGRRPPAGSGRQSEDNRIRPAITIDSAMQTNQERSRTMPAVISETVTKTSQRARPGVQSNWQEPGPVAGYYGPDDRGYTPTSPLRPSDPAYRGGPPKGRPNEERPYGHAAVQNQISNARQPHTHQDSLGDVFDSYYNRPSHQDYVHHNKTKQSQQLHAEDDEMPNFDAVSDQETRHRRGLTIDKHLQPQQVNQERPLLPMHPHHDRPVNQRSDNHVSGPFPRSRSQPNLNERRSPKPQHDDGFDFGVPGPSTKPPATAPPRGNYAHGNRLPTKFPNADGRPMNSGESKREQRIPGATRVPAPGYQNDDWNVSNSGSGRTAAKYQGNGPPTQFFPWPQGRGVYGPPDMTYQDLAQPNQFRPSPPPSHNESSQQRPRRPPSTRPDPSNGDMGNALRPVDDPNNVRSIPAQDGHPRNGHRRPSGGRPSADDQKMRTSPQPKSQLNPDALPAHPAPVRAGLVGSSSGNQAMKPAPVRQYTAIPSIMQLPDPSQKPGSSGSTESKRDSAPVTHQELDRLKQVTARNPNDMATQLTLAKKLVEAASVLVDERADQRTRSKSREKYVFDAHKIVKKLSGNGYTEATFYLADCYTRGSLGLESDTREAFKLYQTAAKANHAQAAYRVAVCCEIGQEEGGGTSRDPVKAMQWYKRAATLGDTPAMYKMGIISLKGLLGQPKNHREAIIWLKLAAEQADKENPHALHELVSIATVWSSPQCLQLGLIVFRPFCTKSQVVMTELTKMRRTLSSCSRKLPI